MKLIIIATALLCSSLVAAQTASPYAGQEARGIKSLSAEEIDGYLKGNGLGYAKPAELNQYPGPKHVIELTNEIGLSDLQLAETKKLFSAMSLEARKLGALYIEKEQELEQAFASQTISREQLKQLLGAIADLEAQIRFVHLDAHLAQTSLLSKKQISAYVRLRGYHGDHSSHHH